MNYLSKFFSSLLPLVLSSGCAEIPPPVSPPYPLKIENYYAYADLKPGSYDIFNIGDEIYCYFYKKLDYEDEMIIYDKFCDLHGDRIVILSGDKVMLSSDIKDLKKETVQNLDYILQNHKKNIIKDTGATFF